MRDPSGKSKGFGFVSYEKHEDANKVRVPRGSGTIVRQWTPSMGKALVAKVEQAWSCLGGAHFHTLPMSPGSHFRSVWHISATATFVYSALQVERAGQMLFLTQK